MLKKLPEQVKACTPVERLIWLYILEYPGEHSARSLTQALGSQSNRAIPNLVGAGLLVEDEPPAGNRPGRYHVPPEARRA